jgi:hypothetical protein
VVAPFLVHDSHQFHPGVVLRVAPHATCLPHGDGAGGTHTFASRNEPSTPLLNEEGPLADETSKLFYQQQQLVLELFLLLLVARNVTAARSTKHLTLMHHSTHHLK